MTQRTAMILAYRYFSLGTMIEPDYGRAPFLVFNEHQETSPTVKDAQIKDIEKFEKILGVGFFEYGPPTWMVGEIEPLKALLKKRQRNAVISDILKKYPSVTIPENKIFYRVRKNPTGDPSEHDQYDSPPKHLSFENGRWDSKQLPVMYCSPDIETCLHELRVISSDKIFLAAVAGTADLKLLDLTHHLEESETWFESLDMSIQFLFQAGSHSYEISRAIARHAKDAGYDGLLVPSHFSSLRTGHHYFQAIKGIPNRAFPMLREQQKEKIVPNILLFDHPVQDEKVKVLSVNSIKIEQARYTLRFGPVIDESLFYI